MSDYAPREGSLGERLLQHLQNHPGRIFTPTELAEACDMSKGNISRQASPLVAAGLVESIGAGRATAYRLAEAAVATEPGGALLIAAYSDGDVSVQGGQRNEDGSTTYTRGQMQQLLQFVTRAPVAMATGATE